MGNKFIYYLKPVLGFFLFIFFIFLWSIPLGLITQFELFKFSNDSLPGQLFFEVAAIFIVLGALLMIFQVYPLRNFETVFIKRDAFFPFIKGSITGLILMGIFAAIMYFVGNVVFMTTKIIPFNIAGYLVFFILVGIFEEFLFRSFPLVIFAERYMIAISILLNGLLFGLIHIINPGFSVLAMINICLCGILFSIITLQERNIWWAVGIHFGWNFTQGNILGFKVSGLPQSGLFVAKPVGSEVLSGGVFGVEGSVFCTIILIIYIIWLIFRQKIARVIEIENSYEFDRER